MLLIYRHILRELLKITFLMLVLLVSLFALFHFLEELNRDYPANIKLSYIANSIPYFIYMLSPLAVLLGSTIAVGKLTINKETQTIIASGISINNLIKKIYTFAFIVATSMSVLGEFYGPFFYTLAKEIKGQALLNQSFQNFSSESWLVRNEVFSNKKIIFHIKKTIEESSFEDISVFEFKDDILVNYLFSKKGYLEENTLKLVDYSSLDIKYDNQLLYQKNLSKNNQEKVYTLSSNQIFSLTNDLNTLTLIDLFERWRYLNSYGLRSEIYIQEIMSRISQPLIASGLLVIILPLVLNMQRNTSIGKMIFFSISLALVFNLIYKFANTLALNIGIDILFSSLAPLVLIYVYVIYIFYKAKKGF